MLYRLVDPDPPKGRTGNDKYLFGAVAGMWRLDKVDVDVDGQEKKPSRQWRVAYRVSVSSVVGHPHDHDLGT